MTAEEIFDMLMRQRQEITSLQRKKDTLRKEHETTSLRKQMERLQAQEREITSLRRQRDKAQAKEREALVMAHRWKDKAVGLQQCLQKDQLLHELEEREAPKMKLAAPPPKIKLAQAPEMKATCATSSMKSVRRTRPTQDYRRSKCRRSKSRFVLRTIAPRTKQGESVGEN